MFARVEDEFIKVSFRHYCRILREMAPHDSWWRVWRVALPLYHGQIVLMRPSRQEFIDEVRKGKIINSPAKEMWMMYNQRSQGILVHLFSLNTHNKPLMSSFYRRAREADSPAYPAVRRRKLEMLHEDTNFRARYQRFKENYLAKY